jgi:hypothetical protein
LIEEYSSFTPTDATLHGTALGSACSEAARSRSGAPPVRVYDSREGSKLDPEQARTITPPESVAPNGTVGVLTQISVLSPSTSGFIQVWSAKKAAWTREN